MSITLEQIKSLPDDELSMFVEAGKDEQNARAERKKQETIARIKELAGTVGVRVAIGGARGRPAKAKAQPVNGNTAAVRKRA
jgi:hypothetical protein